MKLKQYIDSFLSEADENYKNHPEVKVGTILMTYYTDDPYGEGDLDQIHWWQVISRNEKQAIVKEIDMKIVSKYWQTPVKNKFIENDTWKVKLENNVMTVRYKDWNHWYTDECEVWDGDKVDYVESHA